jgi:hypothetical protein
MKKTSARLIYNQSSSTSKTLFLRVPAVNNRFVNSCDQAKRGRLSLPVCASPRGSAIFLSSG